MARPSRPVIVGVDVGGTFTDAVVVHAGGEATAKVLTTPADRSLGVVEAVALALERAGVDPSAVTDLAHGTTVATNALLERRGARTALVTTRGFGDLLALRRQTRPHLYRLHQRWPEPLAALTAEVDERMGPDGVVEPLDSASADRAAARLARGGAEAVAVCLLHSYLHPRHERELAARLRRRLPGVTVTASHELAAEMREYERAATTVADAYLGPPVAGYLETLGGRCAGAGLPAPAVMQSSGGLCDLADAARHPARLLLSGPAGGVAAAVALGHRRLVTFDMGGTSTDVCLITGGGAGVSHQRDVAGVPIRLPQLDIHTVGAGGGSIAWLDPGGALRVGPQSAGAEPGPACYGRGGTLPTVTDADVVLGRIDPSRPLAGGLRLDPEAARAAVATVAAGFAGVRAAAAGIVAVANSAMAEAIRVVSVERGVDPRALSLLAFGGAGPLHACDVAEQLGMRRVLAPAGGGVLSALGIAVCDRRTDAVRSAMLPLHDLTGRRLAALAPRLPGPGPGGRTEISCDLRYAGQSFELTVSADPPATLEQRFHSRHLERFGFADAGAPVELVAVRAASIVPGAGLVRRRARRGSPLPGPASVALAGATLWVAAGWTATPDGNGGWGLRR
ncbi:MAG TPA: hydantoinase/oxoprolinase family protein [Gaiellales bacterium]|nr:hydantoinase/oxoprolinase family protein [Gaiellales bacterium]